MSNYKKLLKYVQTEAQRRAVVACDLAETKKQAAADLGIDLRGLQRTIKRVEAMAEPKKHEATNESRSHCMIPDCQVTPDTPTNHLEWIAQYIVDKQPDVIVNIGDFADFESLSSYDKGRKASEGRRVLADFDAANKANKLLTDPINAAEGYNPEMHLTLGNHENRVNRAVEADASLDGFLSLDNLNYADTGWTVHPFLDQVVLDGVAYSHFFANPMTGKPYGGTNIDTRLKTIGYSFSMGHQQMHMSGQRPLGNGTILRGCVSGSCYLHDEDYKGKSGNVHWRGIVMKHEVKGGNYDIMEVSLNFLCKRYEGMALNKFMEKYYNDIYRRSEWLQRMG